jgi:hypothetical protein
MKTIITRTVTADTATIIISTVTRKGAVVGSTTYVNRTDGYTVRGADFGCIITRADLLRWVDETSAWLAAGAVWPVEYVEA